ncbi:MAG TPA: TonB-dependent receptor, partial [Chitinophagaceae bacterium]|nr:TonB-dependent receptor [Chitinophagaceae bacterium]
NNLSGYWRFGTQNDFYANNPRNFDVAYSNVSGDPKPAARFKAAQLGFYAQDEVQFNNKFRLTYGLRLDVPVINEKPAYNKIVDSTFKGAYSTSNIPTGQLLWSPRIGFNYDVEGDRKVIVRGGIGIFSGRTPFVWVSNQFTNSGTLLSTISATSNINGGKGFEPDVAKQSSLGGTLGRTFETNLIATDFKFPQVLRLNLATDLRLPGGIQATLEGIYSKTLNNVLYQDVNLAPPVGVVDPAYNNGADKRPAYSASTNAGGRRLNPNITGAYLISNTNKGYTYNLTAQLSKTWKHVFASVAYNHNDAADVNSGASSTAGSNWRFVQISNNPNNPPLATSNYALTHRIISVVALNFDYAKYFKTSLAFFYSANSGQKFSYIVNGDPNLDGSSNGNDLIYVPRNASEIRFVDFLNSDNSIRFTAAQQAAAFEDFVSKDKYLNGRRGNYTERNASNTPWEHILDMRLAQDFIVTTGDTRHAFQLTFDVFNFTNLLSNNWGRQYSVGNQSYSILSLINRTTGPVASQGKGYNFPVGQTPWNMGFGSRFQGQIGLRYSFN